MNFNSIFDLKLVNLNSSVFVERVSVKIEICVKSEAEKSFKMEGQKGQQEIEEVKMVIGPVCPEEVMKGLKKNILKKRIHDGSGCPIKYHDNLKDKQQQMTSNSKSVNNIQEQQKNT